MAAEGHLRRRVTLSRTVDFDKLRHRAGAATMIRLMMVCNDLTIANQMLCDWQEACPRERDFRKWGASLYFVRLQIAHLAEGFKVVDKIRKNQSLSKTLGFSDPQTVASFESLTKGKTQQIVRDLSAKIRNNVVSHYLEDESLIEWALGDRSTRPASKASTITRGSHCYLWYFKAADDVIDSIVVRKFFSIPRSADLRTEADKKIREIQTATLHFLDFAGELIWCYAGE